MEATDNNPTVATAQRPFIEKPSLPSDLEIEYQFSIEDTNRPDTSGAGGTLHSLPVQEPRQARADDRRNESENGDRLLLYQKMEVNVNVKRTRTGITPGLSTQTEAREEEPPFPTEQGTGSMFSHDETDPAPKLGWHFKPTFLFTHDY